MSSLQRCKRGPQTTNQLYAHDKIPVYYIWKNKEWCQIKQESLKVNHRIRAESVMLIAEDGEQLGVKSFSDALKIALQDGLDIVEVAPTANPPVCKIMDYGKYKYEQEQKAKRARKHQSTIVIKEMKLRPKIDNHDYETKKKHVIRFLESGNKVKITIMFRGREMVHPEIGSGICEQLVDDVSDIAFVEAPAKQDGRNMIMVLAPIKVTVSDKIAEIPIDVVSDDVITEKVEDKNEAVSADALEIKKEVVKDTKEDVVEEASS